MITQKKIAEDLNIARSTVSNIPVVTLFGNEKLGVASIYEDYADAARQMTEHVASIGHRRILLIISAYRGTRPTASQAEGFASALRRHGGTLLPEEETGWPAANGSGPVGRIARIEPTKDSFDLAASAYEYMRRLIAAGDLPDVIVCGGDHWARGVIAACLEAGIRVPEDLAVTGMDDEAFGRYAPYHLTTIAKPIARGCERAADVLMDLIRGEELPERHFIYPCELVVRKSCGGAIGRAPAEEAGDRWNPTSFTGILPDGSSRELSRRMRDTTGWKPALPSRPCNPRLRK